MEDIAVKTLDGRRVVVPTDPSASIKDFKAEVDARLGGTFKLLARVWITDLIAAIVSEAK